eukprot:GHVU01036700.1.p1 GENE.GHVU01036700.1~~GHVU01036700.1.p1  ORF type:complete len:152 (+),score=21.04 GHVU01036700.1:398-853(+)
MAQMRKPMKMDKLIESLTSLLNNGGSSVDQYIKLPLLPLGEVPKEEKDRQKFLFETIRVPAVKNHPDLKEAINTLISQLKDCVTQLTLPEKTLYVIRSEMLENLSNFRERLQRAEEGSSVEERGGAELPNKEGHEFLSTFRAVDFGDDSSF